MGGRVPQVSDDLVPDDLWAGAAPLLSPPPSRRRCPGRLPADDRSALRGIVYVLRMGVTWADVPTETIGRSRGGVLTASAGLDRGRSMAPPTRHSSRGTSKGGSSQACAATTTPGRWSPWRR
ncbi:transposase [Streptomyces hebeiensis]